QVQHHQVKGLSAFSVAHHHGTATGNGARQPVLFNVTGLDAAEQPVARVGNNAYLAIALIAPPGKTGVGGQVFGLIDKPRAQAAAVHLLERNDVVIAHQLGNGVHVFHRLAVGQNLAPAARDIFAIAAGGCAGLNVVAQQLELLDV